MARSIGKKVKGEIAKYVIRKSIDIGERVLKTSSDTAYTLKSIAKEKALKKLKVK